MFLNRRNNTEYLFAKENDAAWRHKLVMREIKERILRKYLERQEGIGRRGLGLG